MKVSCIFFYLLLIHQTFSFEYAIDAKSNISSPITHYAIFGERCSGTNYLEHLVYQNLFNNEQPLTFTQDYGKKHFPRWFELPLEFYKGDSKKYTFENSENVLFLVIFRNPYDWLRSLHKQPYGSSRELRNLPFSKFIRTTWQIDINRKNIRENFEENACLDRNPEDGNLFENVMKLRSAKIRTMLNIKYRVENIYFINYETLRDYPNQVLDEIATLFKLEKKEKYYPVIYHKGMSKFGIFTPKKYDDISTSDLNYINKQLDENLESELGYTLISESSLNE